MMLVRATLVVAGLASACAAWGGAQQMEALSASVRTMLSRAVSDRSAEDPADAQARAWVDRHLDRVSARFPDDRGRREFLAAVRYEAERAGLDPSLVLAVIDVESQFRKYAVSAAGARGFMQVMPFWVKEIGEPGHNLFHLRTNLRYGCTILRHYLTIEDGNLFNALGRYNGSLGKPDYPNRVLRAYRERWAPSA
jgi:soluble lytic murein transglycosylase-like protein